MFREIRTKITIITSAIILAAGVMLGIGGGQALALNPDIQICAGNSPTGNVCLNAWNGGPWVNVFTNMGAAPNDAFSINSLNNGNTYIEFVGGGSWNGLCIGDANNDPNNDYTGLDQCPTNSNSGGWGTNFKEIINGQGDSFGFKNVHWGGYLQPTGNTNSSHFALLGPQYNFTFFYPSTK